MPRLNLGSGYYPASGWTNVETDRERGYPGVDLYCDVADLPYDDASVEQIYAGHLCEHLPLAKLVRGLQEWRRVLNPGSQLLLVVPDIDRAIARREDWDLLDRICTSNFPPPAGHAWTCSLPVLRHFAEVAEFSCAEVPIEAVSDAEWPIVAHDAWQSALLCRP